MEDQIRAFFSLHPAHFLCNLICQGTAAGLRVSNCFSLFDILVVLNLVPFLFSAQTSIILTKLFLTHFQNRNCLQSAVCILSCESFGYTFEQENLYLTLSHQSILVLLKKKNPVSFFWYTCPFLNPSIL